MTDDKEFDSIPVDSNNDDLEQLIIWSYQVNGKEFSSFVFNFEDKTVGNFFRAKLRIM